MKEITAKEVVKATGGESIFGNPEITIHGISTDTRTLRSGMAYFALEGDRFDGHDFLNEAMVAGCTALIISKEAGLAKALAAHHETTVILVEDTLKALQDLATYYINLFPIPKIGVTGSTGKTTTKEMLYWILSEQYHTVRNALNLNNHIGLPLSIFEIDETTEVAVFEMGMDRLGEIHRLAEIVRPHIAIITNVGLSHIKHLLSRENIRKAKMEITDFFQKDDVLIVNSDNDLLYNLSSENQYHLVKAGRAEDSNLRIVEEEDLGEEGIRFVLADSLEQETIVLSAPGLHNASNAALAVAAAKELGIGLKQAASGLAKLASTDKRLHIIEKQGIKIIDDTYNASPDSMRAAIDVLMSVQGSRKLAILGDMFELGEEEESHHFEVGEYASQAGVDVVISVGKNAQHIDLGARTRGTKSIHFDTKEFLTGVLTQWIRPGDVILVKGSRGMAMDEIVKHLEQLSK